MLTIPRKYIIDESNERIAVQLDINVFEKLEELVEDYALGQILAEESVEEKTLDHGTAKAYYQELDKAK